MIDNAWAVPKMDVFGVEKQEVFSVEYTAKSGIYIGTKITATSLSKVIEKVFEDAAGRDIGCMLITPIDNNATCNFKMLNSSRI